MSIILLPPIDGGSVVRPRDKQATVLVAERGTELPLRRDILGKESFDRTSPFRSSEPCRLPLVALFVGFQLLPPDVFHHCVCRGTLPGSRCRRTLAKVPQCNILRNCVLL